MVFGALDTEGVEQLRGFSFGDFVGVDRYRIAIHGEGRIGRSTWLTEHTRKQVVVVLHFVLAIVCLHNCFGIRVVSLAATSSTDIIEGNIIHGEGAAFVA